MLLFIQEKIIQLSEVKEINKKNSLGVIPNAIKIVTETDEKLFFCSFPNRNTSYDCIYALWKSVSKYAKNHVDKEEYSESDEEIKLDLLKQKGLNSLIDGKESPISPVKSLAGE